MGELRFVRREDRALVLADDAGVEFRFVPDDTALAELRSMSRRATSAPRVTPRTIQTLVRAGKSRQEIVELTGADEQDVERYEEPVLAERSFILNSAHAVPVRTSPVEGSEEKFGTVIGERLLALSAEGSLWRSWRDENTGWMIGLTFTSHEVNHDAVWSFDHRKNILEPVNSDAVTLSRQGEVGDRLIPKLRAVDANEPRERFDSGAFNPDALLGDDDEATVPARPTGVEAAFAAGHPSTGSIPIIDSAAEFARRREIDQRAIKTPEPELPDLGQTADLLDALRKRRGEREVGAGIEAPPEQPRVAPVSERPEFGSTPLAPVPQAQQGQDSETAEYPTDEVRPRRGKGRAVIPSWDDILFGTRSEDDPL